MAHCSQRCQNLFTKTEASQTHLIPAVVLASTTFFSTNVVPGLGDKILLMEHEWLNNTMQWQHYEKENTQLVQSTGRKKKSHKVWKQVAQRRCLRTQRCQI